MLNVALGGVTSLLAIPVIISIVGAPTWGSLAVAQAIGAIYAVGVGFGWGIIGPAQVAGLAVSARGQFFKDSLVSRSLLFACALPAYVVTVLLVLGTRSDIGAFLVGGISTVVVAVGSGWFFVGEAQPARLLFNESLPRALGTIAGAALLFVSHSLLVFVAVQLLGILISIWMTTRSINARHRDGVLNRSVRDGFRRLKDSYASMVTAGTAALYVNVPLIVVSAAVPLATPIYAAAEKIQRFALLAMTPFTQVVQGYIPNADDTAGMRGRINRSVAIAFGFGVALAVGLGALLPWVAHLMTAGKVAVPFTLSIPMGMTTGLIVISGVTGLAALVALGKQRTVAMSTVAGACVGLPLTVILGLLVGVEGIAWAVTISEVLVLAIQLVALARALPATGRR